MPLKISQLIYNKREVFWEIMLLLAVFVLVFEIKYYHRFYPNIYIGDEPVGGKSYEEVAERFKEAEEKISQEGFTLVFFRNSSSRTVNVPVASQGLTSDTVVEYFTLTNAEETVKNAYSMGRRGSLASRFWEQLSSILGKRTISFSNTLREEAVRSLLERELVNFYDQPVSAEFQVQNGKTIIRPEKIGERIDSNGDKVIRLLNNSLATLKSDALFFSSKPALPRITAKKLQPFLPIALEITKKTKAKFIYGEYQWNVSGNTLVNWLTLDEKDNLVIDRAKLESFLSTKIKPLVYNPPENSRFEVQNGKLVEIFKGKSGNSIAVESIEEKLNEQLAKAQETFLTLVIKVAVKQEPPRITKETVDKYGIKELVATVRTSFKGSTPGRKHNIAVGVSKLNGLFIAPGEEFSTVEGIGFTREEDGFLKEFVIKGDRSVKEAGGGLCQIATTLFRLAINAGLPITARTNHLYVVGYYGPGLDATVYGQQKDLKFINDTGHYLLLQAKVVGDEVVMDFYGQKDGREVVISEPKISDRIPPPKPKYIVSPELKPGQEKCTEQARYGLTAEVNYQVRYPNDKINEQTFKSVYTPWQKVCLVGSPEQQLTPNN